VIDLLDDAESLRRKGHTAAALELVDRVLDARPAEPRALLLKSRLEYQSGRIAEALDDLRVLEPSLGRAEMVGLRTALERLDEDAQTGPAFATESMARLLEQQGYRLEALEVYRQLFETASNRDELREEIMRLKDDVEREGSRDASDQRARRELELWQRWLEEHPRGA
jgi:tetratricopeptide (TPR) repeat protein